MLQQVSNKAGLWVQILDPELFDLMRAHEDFANYSFAYRWFLLDFKRELVYEGLPKVWEVLWACSYLLSTHLNVLVAVALVALYRDVLLDNHFDLMEAIRFFNEMAEKHPVEELLAIARHLLLRVHRMLDTTDEGADGHAEGEGADGPTEGMEGRDGPAEGMEGADAPAESGQKGEVGDEGVAT